MVMAGKRLKKKDELRYRKGGTSSECGHCNSFVGDFKRHGLGGDFIAEEPRCRVIGLEHGTPYRVRADHQCDRFDNAIYLLRLMGDKDFKRFNGQERFDTAVSLRKEREEFEAARKY